MKIENGRYAVEAAEVRLIEGLPFNGTVDAYAIQLLAACPAIVRRLTASGFLV